MIQNEHPAVLRGVPPHLDLVNLPASLTGPSTHAMMAVGAEFGVSTDEIESQNHRYACSRSARSAQHHLALSGLVQH